MYYTLSLVIASVITLPRSQRDRKQQLATKIT